MAGSFLLTLFRWLRIPLAYFFTVNYVFFSLPRVDFLLEIQNGILNAAALAVRNFRFTKFQALLILLVLVKLNLFRSVVVGEHIMYIAT